MRVYFARGERCTSDLTPESRSGHDVLGRGLFSLGRQHGCDLVFDGAAGQSVSPRHCEIIYERRQYVLCDRSREGTLVNDRLIADPEVLRPGDWIRLGPNGPLLRFLGRPGSVRGRVTTA